MGHYDSFYEADAHEQAQKRAKEVNKEIKKLLETLTTEQKEFLLLTLQNINDYTTTIKFLEKIIKLSNKL